MQYAHGDLCKHLGKYSSTDLDDRYSNLFLNAKTIEDPISNTTCGYCSLSFFFIVSFHYGTMGWFWKHSLFKCVKKVKLQEICTGIFCPSPF